MNGIALVESHGGIDTDRVGITGLSDGVFDRAICIGQRSWPVRGRIHFDRLSGTEVNANLWRLGMGKATDRYGVPTPKP
jgi:hypothetical protein